MRVPSCSPERIEPEIFHEYWKASLEDAGIVGLEPVEIGSRFVPLDGIHASRVIRVIIERWLAESGEDLEAAIEDACGLPGGAVLRSEGRTIVTPRCYACVDDIDDWAKVAGYREPGWSMLWTGHPWLSIRSENDHLILSEPHEGDTPVERWRIHPSAVEAAHSHAVAVLERFSERLRSVPTRTRSGLARVEAGSAPRRYPPVALHEPLLRRTRESASASSCFASART